MHLEIRQTTDRIEQVPSSVVNTLYNLSKHDVGLTRELDNTSYLSGTINAPVAAEKTVQTLNNEWPDLTVTASVYAVDFNDSEVTRILTNQYGDLTTSTVNSITSIGTLFKESTIVDFSDMNQLSAVSVLAYDAFEGCANLTQINLNNITTIQYAGGQFSCICFRNCSSLTSIYAPQLTAFAMSNNDGSASANHPFVGCSQLKSIDLPMLQGSSTNDTYARTVVFFGSQTPILEYVNLGHLKLNMNTGDAYHGGSFNNIGTLKILDLGDNVQSIKDYTIQNCINLKAIVIRNTSDVVPYMKSKSTVTIENLCGGSSSAYVYVPDDMVSQYQAADNWSTISSRILGISSYDKETILNS